MSATQDLAKVLPRDARRGFRDGGDAPCSQLSRGYLQANIVCVPSALADDFEEYCRLNTSPCPLLYRSRPGEVAAAPLADNVDVRTDLPFYTLGKFDDFTPMRDLLDVPWEDMVTFYIGCSFSFEYALLCANIPLPPNPVVYRLAVPCCPVGPFAGRMLASMRPFPRALVQRAVEITAPLEFCHGAPIHIGDPRLIGIKDPLKKDFGETPLAPAPGDVPVFWGCGMTGFEAVMSAKPPVSASLGPGCSESLLITDLLTMDYKQLHPSTPAEEEPPVPRVTFLREAPLFATIASERALQKIQSIPSVAESTSRSPSSQPAAFLNTALRLSHAPVVAIVVGSSHDPLSEACSTLSLAKALSALGKDVALVATDDDSYNTWRALIGQAVELGVLKIRVPLTSVPDKDSADNASICAVVPSLQSALDLIVRSSAGTLNATYAFSEEKPNERKASSKCSADGDSCQGTEATLDGHAHALALCILNSCPVHSRYVRHGTGEGLALSAEEMRVTPTEVKRCLSSADFPPFATEEAWSLVQHQFEAVFGA